MQVIYSFLYVQLFIKILIKLDVYNIYFCYGSPKYAMLHS